jgi:hypothetical protein
MEARHPPLSEGSRGICRFPNHPRIAIPTETLMGRRPKQGNENYSSSATAFNGSVTLPLASVPRHGGPTHRLALYQGTTLVGPLKPNKDLGFKAPA